MAYKEIEADENSQHLEICFCISALQSSYSFSIISEVPKVYNV